MGLRVLVCGGSNFSNALRLAFWLYDIEKKHGIDVIIHGAGDGADYLAGMYAEYNGIPCLEYPAFGEKHGKDAVQIRNSIMLSESKPDLVVVFGGGEETADIVSKARAAGVQVMMATKGAL